MKNIVLNFHGIGQCPSHLLNEEGNHWVSIDTFKKCCQYAAESKENIIFTFDDGNKSDIEVAVPLLKKYQLPGQFFILINRIGQPGYLNKDDMKEILNQGFEIGLHGDDHVSWKKIEPTELFDRLVKAKEQLEGIVGKPIAKVACPFGSYNKKVIQVLKKIEFSTVYTSDPGINSEKSWFCRRITIKNFSDLKNVFSSFSPLRFEYILQNVKSLIKKNL